MENQILKLYNLPTVNNYESYKNYAYSIRNLSKEEEFNLISSFKNNNCLISVQKLILSQLKSVIKIAKDYSGYGIPEEDLVQEGNIGLMKAIKNYSLSYDVRLYSYALLWIKSEIQNYILKNWKMIKIGTTNAYKKLFFNYKSIQKKLIDKFTDKKKINYNIAKELDVDIDDVNNFEQYIHSDDILIEDAEEQNLLITYKNPESIVAKKLDTHFISNEIKNGLEDLTDNEKEVIISKFYSEEKQTNKEISVKLGVSSERVRQIENNALKKLKDKLQQFF